MGIVRPHISPEIAGDSLPTVPFKDEKPVGYENGYFYLSSTQPPSYSEDMP
jgi:hypothetical protein